MADIAVGSPEDKRWAEQIARIRAEERERCARIVRRICGETRHVTLGDRIVSAIDNPNSEEQ